MMNTLQVAQSWIDAGFSVIPIGYRSKRPAFDALRLAGCTTEDGRPSWEAFKKRAATPNELRLWFGGPRRNLGVVTGWRGLVVLDFDQTDAYECWLAWAAMAGDVARRVAENTYRVFSARGVHVYVICEEPVESYAVPGIDVKSKWGYVLAPPSVHPSGREYRAEGAIIARCTRLTEVFPFEKPAAVKVTMAPLGNDPWDEAGKAVACASNSLQIAKERVHLEELIKVVYQDRAGSWATCPLHEDAHPSLRVYPDGHMHCFQCGFHGDAVDVYARVHGLTLGQAIQEIVGG